MRTLSWSRKTPNLMLVAILLVTLSLAVAVQPAQAATCFSGQGFGWRDGHHYVWFVVNMSANNWEVTEPWYVPNANLWAYPDGNGYAEAGFPWIDGVPIPFSPSVYQLCGWS